METKTPRIFIVEDDKLLSFVEERLVKKLGYGLAGKAADGEQAVEQIKANDPDLIIMDIRLDGSMDGIQAMKEVRKFSSVPVIFLSGDSKDETQERLHEVSNCIDYLVKPVNADDLREPLSNVFNGSVKNAPEDQALDSSSKIASA